MKIKISADLTDIHPAFFNTVSIKTERVLTGQIFKDTKEFVPALTGNFSGLAYIDSGNVIVYRGPQVRFLYKGKVMIYPPTGSTWAPKKAQKKVTDKDLVFSKDMNKKAQAHWMEASEKANIDKWLKFAADDLEENI